jgi:hypothetical protein
MTYEKIKERYLNNYIRDDRLERFVKLGCLTEEQAEALKAEKNGEVTE